MTGASMQMPTTGGCQCGAVRYALRAAPERVHVCHCRMCQKAVGGPFAALAPVARENFAWTRAEPGIFRSSSTAERFFCRRCGTPLGFAHIDTQTISVTIGSLDRPQDAVPTLHGGIESRLAWLDRLGAIPTHTTQALVPPERLARCTSYQHPDHETAPDWRPPRGRGGDRGNGEEDA
jgi:hypothetical protein